jgi:serine/threonine protein kinase
MSAGAPAFGERIGDYRLVREVGRGAMGVVFEALDAEDRRVALKVLVPPALMPAEEREGLHRRFLREASALGAVDHPNVVRIHQVGEADGHLYLAMDFLDGRNLREVLRDGPLPPAHAVTVAGQLLDALEAVHTVGIVHRDVKPENAVVLADGTVKLTDFGIARIESEATLTRTGGILGSPAYMSPEQILGRQVDRRSDLFSLAATLYQLLADRLPFEGAGLMEMAHNVAYAEPRPLPPSVPYALARVVLRGLQKSPAARFATAAEFAHALRRAAAGPETAPAAATPLVPPLPAGPADGEPLARTVLDAAARCPRHPRQPAVGHCRACGRALCRACARQDRPPYYCFIHRPVTIFGISAVRLEVALAALAFLLLLLTLSPLGYAAFTR